MRNLETNIADVGSAELRKMKDLEVFRTIQCWWVYEVGEGVFESFGGASGFLQSR